MVVHQLDQNHMWGSAGDESGFEPKPWFASKVHTLNPYPVVALSNELSHARSKFSLKTVHIEI